MDKRSDSSLDGSLGTVPRDRSGTKQRRLVRFCFRAAGMDRQLELSRSIRRPCDATLRECRRVKPPLVPQTRARRHRRLVSGRSGRIPAGKQQFVFCLRIRRCGNPGRAEISANHALQCERAVALLVFAGGHNANKTRIRCAKPHPVIGEDAQPAGPVCTRAEQKEHQIEAASDVAGVGVAFGGGHRCGHGPVGRYPNATRITTREN